MASRSTFMSVVFMPLFSRDSHRSTVRIAAFVLMATLPVIAACSRGGPAGPPKLPPTPVGVEVLQPRPVVISSEFVSVIRSRRASEVRPQVEGIITHILVKSGDKVTDGRTLLQIDDSKQRATVESDNASRAAQEESVHYAQQQFDRAKELLNVGAISQQEFEQ